jgi:hypothetical protein
MVITNSNSGSSHLRTLTLTNTGSSSVPIVNLAEALPASTRFVELHGSGAFSNGCSYEPVGHQVSCLGRMVRTGSHHVVITHVLEDRLLRNGFE